MMPNELCTLIGNPANGFGQVVDWRAHVASLCSNLLKTNSNSGLVKSQIEQFDENEISDWINSYTHPHPLSLAYLAEVYAEVKSYNSPNNLANKTIKCIHTFDSCCDTLLGSKAKLIAKEPATEVIIDALRMKSKGSRKDDCLDSTLLLSDNSMFYIHKQRIEDALLLLKEICPGYYSDFEELVQYVVLTESASFRGSSSLDHLGMIYFCPDNDWSVLTWAEELVHESFHQLLEYLAFENKLFTSDEATSSLKFSAPIREDKRPPYGIYHALFVVARLNSFYLEVESKKEISGH